MKKYLLLLFIIILFAGCQTTVKNEQKSKVTKNTGKYTDTFEVDKKNLSSTGENTFFILKPGYTLEFRGKGADGPESDILEVTNQTKKIDGVETRVVKDTHKTQGKIDEIALDYFAIDKVTNTVFYFGEDVDNIEDGKVINHEGTWHSGEKGARFGVNMPGLNLIGARYMQEIAPDVALDRAETVSMNETVKTPSGTYDNCLKVKETTPLEPDIIEYKIYAPGVGFVAETAPDGGLKLVKKGFK